MSLTKARIEVDEAGLRNLPKSFDVQFNPTEYAISKSVQFAEVAVPGLDSPILQFVRGTSEELTMDLYFDTTINPDDETTIAFGSQGVVDVRTETGPFYQLVRVQPELHAPPRIRFIWSSLTFKAVVTNIRQRFTLFNPDGVPLRATLTVTFKEYQTLQDQLERTPRQSSDHTLHYVVARGDTLPGIAARLYRNPAAWRPIASQNGILNPRQLVPGTELLIPPLDLLELAASSDGATQD